MTCVCRDIYSASPPRFRKMQVRWYEKLLISTSGVRILSYYSALGYHGSKICLGRRLTHFAFLLGLWLFVLQIAMWWGTELRNRRNSCTILRAVPFGYIVDLYRKSFCPTSCFPPQLTSQLKGFSCPAPRMVCMWQRYSRPRDFLYISPSRFSITIHDSQNFISPLPSNAMRQARDEKVKLVNHGKVSLCWLSKVIEIASWILAVGKATIMLCMLCCDGGSFAVEVANGRASLPKT